ncbi:MAG: PAS domain S-box protein [Candidatus Sulfobium sp.]|jgi:PAS domain S-box-containing protein
MHKSRSRNELLEDLDRLRRRVSELKSGTGEYDQCYRELFGESKDVVYVSSRDGRILDFNRAGLELFGYSREEMIGMDISVLYADPGERERFQDQIEREGAVKDFEMRLRRKDGTIMDCLLSSTLRLSAEGEVLGYQGIIRDITEVRRAERALRASEERFSKVFHSSPDWIAITTLSDGRFIEVNEAFLNITGYKREEVIGRTAAQLNLWSDPGERTRMADLLRERGIIRDHEAVFRMKSGESRTMLRSAELVELGGETCVINITRDITDRKRAEEKIRKLNRELEQRVKELQEANRELDAFSHSVSHDLRTPLITIGGFARRLSKGYSGVLDNNGRDMLDLIGEKVRKMEDLINDLLAFSRFGRQQLKLAEVDTEELVKSAFQEVRATAADRKIEFTTGEFPPIFADESLMRQVFINLLSNAVKFTRLRKTARIEVSCSREGGGTVCSVKDNGVGFSADQAGGLFDVFHRAHGSEDFEGTGIGLSIVRRIISRHCGRVWAEGRPEEGAAFYFFIPDRKSGECPVK